jgi:hypothetical protein
VNQSIALAPATADNAAAATVPAVPTIAIRFHSNYNSHQLEVQRLIPVAELEVNGWQSTEM